MEPPDLNHTPSLTKWGHSSVSLTDPISWFELILLSWWYFRIEDDSVLTEYIFNRFH